jgi:hypothetical protein
LKEEDMIVEKAYNQVELWTSPETQRLGLNGVFSFGIDD